MARRVANTGVEKCMVKLCSELGDSSGSKCTGCSDLKTDRGEMRIDGLEKKGTHNLNVKTE
jgi:hypothetical protein